MMKVECLNVEIRVQSRTDAGNDGFGQAQDLDEKDAGETDAKKEDASKSKSKADADMTEPHVSAPKISTPKVSTPKVSTPKVSTPQVSTPKVSAPQVSTPKVSAPKVSKPDVSAPQASVPHVSVPNASKPSASAPGVGTPRVNGDAAPARGKDPSPAATPKASRVSVGGIIPNPMRPVGDHVPSPDVPGEINEWGYVASGYTLAGVSVPCDFVLNEVMFACCCESWCVCVCVCERNDLGLRLGRLCLMLIGAEWILSVV